MKIAAIYNVWSDGIDLLQHSIDNISPVVDGIIIVWSATSNYGVYDPSIKDFINENNIWVQAEPDLRDKPSESERKKRNAGLQKARELGFTHFVMMDADEFYVRSEFLKEKDRFLNDKLHGLVCRSQVYFKSPELTIGMDVTLVPFIHKIGDNLSFTWNKNYPYAWSSTNGVPFTPVKRIRIDPTRQMSITSGIEWSEIIMHHYSWVRKDIEKKIKNSSARYNIEISTVRQDFLTAKDGQYCQFYDRQLARCPNLFGLPEI